ncbi:hypothetical protein D9M70_610890 [compost metagenome]
MPGRWRLAQQPAQAETVHVRHVHVQHDQVRTQGQCPLIALVSIAGQGNAPGLGLEQDERRTDILRDVVDQQNMRRLGRHRRACLHRRPPFVSSVVHSLRSLIVRLPINCRKATVSQRKIDGSVKIVTPIAAGAAKT